MKLVNQGHSIYRYDFNLDPITNIYNQIEFAGRTCYKSTRPEGKTAEDFVRMLVKNKHYAVLEQGTVYLHREVDNTYNTLDKYSRNPYSRYYSFIVDGKLHEYITTNLRVLKENDWEYDLKYVCHPTKYHSIRKTVKFICSRAIAQELTRHRAFSFAMESQRYCNYSADKFNNEVTYIIPSFFEANPDNLEFLYSIDGDYSSVEIIFIMSCVKNERHYFELLKTLPPEHARSVLNNSCKTELVMTGFVEDWKHLFELRSSKATTGKPHPDMVNLIDNLIHSNFYNEIF